MRAAELERGTLAFVSFEDSVKLDEGGTVDDAELANAPDDLRLAVFGAPLRTATVLASESWGPQGSEMHAQSSEVDVSVIARSESDGSIRAKLSSATRPSVPGFCSDFWGWRV